MMAADATMLRSASRLCQSRAIVARMHNEGAARPGAVAGAVHRIENAVRPHVEVTPAPEQYRVDWDVPVVVRDGTTLRVNVFHPGGDGPVPVIMSAHPYGKDKIPARTRSGHGLNFQYHIFPQPEPVRISAWASWEAPDPAFWLPRGFAVVNADMRGAGTSEGVGELLSDAEARDYYDLIEWAAAQPWCNGKVGLDGVSYLAISQYRVAALRPPHLAAICPWEGFSDLYRDFARPGGVREEGFTVIWSEMTAKTARLRGDLHAELAQRDERDEWYEAATPHLEDIEVPMLVCGSFSDHSLHTRGSFEAFRRAGSARKWLYTHRDGKWSHYYGETAAATRARFFEHFLLGADNGRADEPPVRLAVHEGAPVPAEVTGEAQWPPADLRWTPLALDFAGHELLPGAESAPAGSCARFAAEHGMVSLWWVAPRDMDIIGPMALPVFVELDGADDITLMAGVRKFRGADETPFEGSYGFACDMVSKGWQRAAFRTLDPALATRELPVHTFRDPQPLQPGEIVPKALLDTPAASQRGARTRRGGSTFAGRILPSTVIRLSAGRASRWRGIAL
jgi:predicted acyl esterase